MPKRRTRHTRYRSSRRRTTRRRTKRTNRSTKRGGRRATKRRRTTRRRRHSKIPKGKRCSDLLSEKIRYNMKEFKAGKFVSPAQAIAVAYKQLGKIYPSCKPVFTKKRNQRQSRF